MLPDTYNSKTWENRHQQRIDISTAIVHFTKEADIDGRRWSAVEILVKILKEKTLKGGTGFVVGPHRAVCFQDSPMLGLAQNVQFERECLEKGGRLRYRGTGPAFNKRYAFKLGARPVLYERTEVAKKLLPEAEHWRIVNLNLSDKEHIIDWTHEREWRAPDDISFNRKAVAVFVEDAKAYKEFLSLAGEMAQEVVGIVMLSAALI
jgi:hypothetical protein